ncbi:MULTISPECIES: hypothetical protein [unclassified Corynebacterium]|uniref:hypothetical protein n=1 Tax=unclassified Corynebacterium TaxID=2624378 RepID=UPI0029CA1A50|nr:MULTISPECIES: hypothetical protein [unclassified Corynebacterium]WPF66229.1 hypothetical protein OLX12_00390 [Corynebacterium sp. 22KM0430]WPF68719.1 hypothetical protein OLW90_00390 [Corynebacterium sp. 21KM1197]
MPRYRLQPDRPLLLWWGLLAALAVYFGVPAALNAVVPPRSATADAVELGTHGGDWKVPVAGLECRSGGFSLTETWTCGDTLLSSTVMEGVKDEDRTLRRLMRGASEDLAYPSADASRTEHEGIPMLIDGPRVALLHEGPDGQHLGVVLDGPQQGILDKILDALTEEARQR